MVLKNSKTVFHELYDTVKEKFIHILQNKD